MAFRSTTGEFHVISFRFAVQVALCVMPAILAGCGGDGGSPSAPPQAATLSCDDSIKTNFKPDAQTTVLLVKAFKKGDALLSPSLIPTNPSTAQADLCLVKLLVGPGNPGPADAPSTSSGIGIEVWLPTKSNFNGRFHVTGGGGWSGTAEASLTQNSALGLGADTRNAPWIAATEGAVTASTDTGHAPAANAPMSNGAFAMNPDGTINTTLWNDFSSRSVHEMVVKGKALVAAYYGSAPSRTYWDGASTGGRQGLKQAQVYPADFDGIIVGAPAINWTQLTTAIMYTQTVIQRDLNGSYLSAGQWALVSNAAISSCDLAGGQHLGYIMDPASCRYDPTLDPAVLCAAHGGTNATADCVSPSQANAVNKIWYGMTADGSVPAPAVDTGWGLSPSGVQRWYGLARGTFMLNVASPVPFFIASDQLALTLQNPTIAAVGFSNASGNGADGWATLSYAQLSNAFDRGLALDATFGKINTDEPDLTAFKARGGKIIHFHGLNDFVIAPQGSINYYNNVLTKMGGLAAVQSFYKLYLVPGMGHGPGNGTANPNATPPYPAPGQLYQALTDWVEKGIAPDRVEATSQTPGTQITQPLCPSPRKATYVSGDPQVSASYSCS